jgi:hypothetical protein
MSRFDEVELQSLQLKLVLVRSRVVVMFEKNWIK